ncbi:MAG: hypothetical protein DLM60_16440 [Pseudonocardiales bacterium]|nr:MAG: hypothetical protein DLM60_16440 [Pseudonocardiales bacterium]
MAAGGGEVDTSGWQQMQVPVVWAARPPKLFDARPPALIAEIRLGHRSAYRRRTVWSSTGRGPGGKLRLGYLQGRQVRRAARRRGGKEPRLASDLPIRWGLVHSRLPRQ